LRTLRVPIPSPGRQPAASAPVLVLVATGLLTALFSAYDHQAEPDRFLLCAPFAIAIGLAVDRIVRLVRTHVDESAALQLQGAFALMLLLLSPRREFVRGRPESVLDSQIETGKIVSVIADAYGSVWSYGCFHLMGLAHLTNHHPLDHIWDDLRPYVDEATFLPIARGRLPDVILFCRKLPGPARLRDAYTPLDLPLGESAHVLVRKSAIVADAATAARPRQVGPPSSAPTDAASSASVAPPTASPAPTAASDPGATRAPAAVP
jgi:hypothetical protein